jgi:hypothetical protein
MMAYQPIENYGIIGNMRTVALVNMNGSSTGIVTLSAGRRVVMVGAVAHRVHYALAVDAPISTSVDTSTLF